MSGFARAIAGKIEAYIRLRCSLGYSFRTQAGTLRAFRRFVEQGKHTGPLTQAMVVTFVLSSDVTPTVRARRYSVLRQFAEYLSVFDVRTETLDPRALPRGRLTPPARILTDSEVANLLAAARDISPDHPMRGQTLYTLVGLLASTGLRSGEALRLDRAAVDLDRGVLQIHLTKFRKNRLVPIHATTAEALRSYAIVRDRAYPRLASSAFFLNLRGQRFSPGSLSSAFRQACVHAGLDRTGLRPPRPHDLRHRFAVARLVEWHREGVDVQAHLPLLATYLGHARYTDTAYYITGTAELLGIAAERTFGRAGGAS
ncbi:MAG: tyrosine-type recombinase/integrase [Planctomycetes bacterium]|nr:tyrosine-type recombinase/integrase [Planctomycetota bacterium]